MKIQANLLSGYLLRGVLCGKLTASLFVASLEIRDANPELACKLTALRDELDAIPVSSYYRRVEADEVDVEVVEEATNV